MGVPNSTRARFRDEMSRAHFRDEMGRALRNTHLHLDDSDPLSLSDYPSFSRGHPSQIEADYT